MQEHINKAKVLIESVPYIKEYTGKTVVIKFGGSVMIDKNKQEKIIEDISLLKLLGINIVLVHGGGPIINNTLKKFNKESVFKDGLRVTDLETVEVVEMVLSGKINKEIANEIQKNGLDAVGISGKDGSIFLSKKKIVNGKDIGFVGEIEEVKPKLINSLIDNGFIPVIAPIGRDEKGNTYNINADYAAVALAEALNSKKLVYITDVKGVLRDITDEKSLISSMSVDEALENMKNGVISGGMIPKVKCCIDAVNKGVKRVHIIDGRVEHSLLLEVFTKEGIGTMFE